MLIREALKGDPCLCKVVYNVLGFHFTGVRRHITNFDAHVTSLFLSNSCTQTHNESYEWAWTGNTEDTTTMNKSMKDHLKSAFSTKLQIVSRGRQKVRREHSSNPAAVTRPGMQARRLISEIWYGGEEERGVLFRLQSVMSCCCAVGLGVRLSEEYTKYRNGVGAVLGE